MKKGDIFITFPKTNIFFVILVFIFLVYQDISFSQNLVQDTLIISFKNMKNKEHKFIVDDIVDQRNEHHLKRSL